MKLRPTSIRALLALVLLIAVGMGIVRERHDRFTALRDYHSRRSTYGPGNVTLDSAIEGLSRELRPGGPPFTPAEGKQILDERHWHAVQYRKYRWAARNPHLPLWFGPGDDEPLIR